MKTSVASASAATAALVLLQMPLASLAFGNATERQLFPACQSTISDHIDYSGNDFFIPVKQPTANDCCGYCMNLLDCNAFIWTQFDGGTCYFKDRVSAPVKKDPAPNGSAYMRAGVVFKCGAIMVNTDLVGSDAGSVPATSPDMCCGHCLNWNSGCTGFSWSSYNGGTCWIKNGALTAVPGTGVFSTKLAWA